MKFRTFSRASIALDTSLVYRADEFSFDVEPACVGGFTSILVNDLNLEVTDAGRIISVWGMSPYPQWKRAELASPIAHFGEVFGVDDTPFIRGVSVRINPMARWDTFADMYSGWICLKSQSVPASATEFLPGAILETSQDGDFCALWLKPERFPKKWRAER